MITVAQLGDLLVADADWSGKGGPPLIGSKPLTKTDSLTTTHALQMKSRAGNPPFDAMEIGDPIAVDEWAQFVTEAREQGKRPAFLSNASFGPEMSVQERWRPIGKSFGRFSPTFVVSRLDAAMCQWLASLRTDWLHSRTGRRGCSTILICLRSPGWGWTSW